MHPMHLSFACPELHVLHCMNDTSQSAPCLELKGTGQMLAVTYAVGQSLADAYLTSLLADELLEARKPLAGRLPSAGVTLEYHFG